MDEQSKDLSLPLNCFAFSLAKKERNLASALKIIDSIAYQCILQESVLALHMFFVDLMNQ